MKKFTDKINESVEENIPTAYDFLTNFTDEPDDDTIYEAMIEFAKLHVEACKKEISEKAKVSDNVSEFLQRDELGFEGDTYIDKYSILNSYPLENIK
jgi:tRNA(His) 5'-end guanylyltransferase